MSDTLEAPAVETNDTPADRFAGAEFGSEAVEPRHEVQTAPNTEEAPQPEAPKEPEEPKWYLKRIGSITAKYKSEAERSAALERELEQYRRAVADQRGEPQPEPELTPEQIRQQERDNFARQQTEEKEASAFNAQADAIARSVAAAHGDAAVANATQMLSERAGLDFTNKSHRELIADISELPNSGQVYYALANDPDAASELLEASSRKQFAMLQKFANSIEAPTTAAPTAARAEAPKISQAPAPIAATRGSGRTVSSRSIYDQDLSPEDYIRLRSKK